MAGQGDVAGVAVVLRQGRRAVQVGGGPRHVAQGRVLGRQLVDLADDDRPVALHPDGRPGHRAVVGEHRRLDPGQDLPLDLLLGDLVDVAPADATDRLQYRGAAEGQRVRLRDPALGQLRGPIRRQRPGQGDREGRGAQDTDLECVAAGELGAVHGVPPTGLGVRPESPPWRSEPFRSAPDGEAGVPTTWGRGRAGGAGAGLRASDEAQLGSKC